MITNKGNEKAIFFCHPSEIKAGIYNDRPSEGRSADDALKKSIKEIGQLQPIVVSSERELMAGSRRLAACQALGVPVMCITSEAAALAVSTHENMYRVDVTWYQRACSMHAYATEKKIGAKEVATLAKVSVQTWYLYQRIVGASLPLAMATLERLNSDELPQLRKLEATLRRSKKKGNKGQHAELMALLSGKPTKKGKGKAGIKRPSKAKLIQLRDKYRAGNELALERLVSYVLGNVAEPPTTSAVDLM